MSDGRNAPPTSLGHVWALIDLRRWNDAMAGARQLIAQDPGSAAPWLAFGIAASGAGHHDLAFDAAGRAAAIDPTNPAAHRLLAIAQTHVPAQRRHARRSARRAVALDPDDPVSYRVLADVALVVERRGDAARAIRRHLALAPDSASGWVSAAEIQLTLGAVDLAEDSLRRALRLEPDHHAAVSLLGFVLARNGDLQGALRLHRSAIGAVPDESHYLLLAGRSANRRTLFPIGVVLGASFGMFFTIAGMLVGGYAGGYAVNAVDRRRVSRGRPPLLLAKQFADQPGMARAVLDYRQIRLRRVQIGPDVGMQSSTLVAIGVVLLALSAVLARSEPLILIGMLPLTAVPFGIAAARRRSAHAISRRSTDSGS